MERLKVPPGSRFDTGNNGEGIGESGPGGEGELPRLEGKEARVEMKKITVTLALLALCLALAPAVPAEEKDGPEWDFFGSLRVRPEYNENLSDVTAQRDDKIFYGAYRANLGASVTLDNGVRAVLDLQGMGLWGEDQHPYRGWITEDDSSVHFSVFQAYIEAKNIFGSKFSARAGRQPLIYGDEWLVGDLDFYGGTSFDGFWGEFDRKNGYTSLFYTKLAETSSPEANFFYFNEDDSRDSDFSGIWSGWNFGDNMILEGGYMYLLDDMSMTEFGDPYKDKRQTATVQFAYNKDHEAGYFMRINTAYQWGTLVVYDEGQEDLDISAEAAEITLGWIWVRADNPYKLWVRGAHYSGDESDTDDYEAFIPLFQDTHNRYGLLDFWHGQWGFVPYLGGNPGFQAIQIGSSATLPNGITLKVLAQQLHRAEDFSPTMTNRKLGSEFNISASYNYGKNLSLELGIAQLYPGTAIGYEPPFFPSTTTRRAYLHTVVHF
jgi:hypothetical protein